MLQLYKRQFGSTYGCWKINEWIYEKLSYIKEKPFSRPFVHDDFLSSLGIRSIKVKNYIVFYYVEEDKNKKCVNLVSFMYSKRDWINILKEMDIKNNQ